MEFFTNPWVIGIGTAVIAGLILRFALGVGKPKPKHGQIATVTEERNRSTSPPVPAEQAPSDITPLDIIDYLDSLPPLQKDSAAEHYKGIKVSWQVYLTSGHALGKGKLRLMMGVKKSIRPWIFCEVDPKQYPLLRVIKKTQSFRVDGKIKQVSGGDIELENCRLSF
jgi:hypothetical protein